MSHSIRWGEVPRVVANVIACIGIAVTCGCTGDLAAGSPKGNDAGTMTLPDGRVVDRDARVSGRDARTTPDADAGDTPLDARVIDPDAGPIPDMLSPMPIISRGKRVTASADVAMPQRAVDGVYCEFPAWSTTTFPSWLAIEIGQGPSRLLFSWTNAFTKDYVNDGERSRGSAISYLVQTSANSTNGSDGTWTTVADVTANRYRTRAHAFDFAGSSWVRMTVREGHRGSLAIDEIDVHDASSGNDAVFFMGASITAGAFGRCRATAPSYAELVNDADSDYFPAIINGGIAGLSSDFGAANVDNFLQLNAPYRVWGIGYGTNDARRNISDEAYRTNMRAIVSALQAAGKVVVISSISYASAGPDNGGPDDARVRALNAVIEEVRLEAGLLRGPDLYTWFRDHPEQLEMDGVHPNADGSREMNRMWFEALRPLYGL